MDSKKLIQHGNIFIEIDSDINEREIDLITRKWFIIKNIQHCENIHKLLNLSKIYVCMKNIGCEYSEEITSEIKQCEKRLFI